VLAGFIEERHARSRVVQTQKGLDKKFSAGDVKLSEYKARQEEATKAANYARAMLRNTTGTLSLPVFAVGSESSPVSEYDCSAVLWRGRGGAFMVLSMTRMLKGTSPYPMSDLLHALLESASEWAGCSGVRVLQQGSADYTMNMTW
jgi:hypothetical protein